MGILAATYYRSSVVQYCAGNRTPHLLYLYRGHVRGASRNMLYNSGLVQNHIAQPSLVTRYTECCLLHHLGTRGALVKCINIDLFID